MNNNQLISVLTKGLETFGEYNAYNNAAYANELNAGLFELQGRSVIEQGEQSVRIQEKQADKIIGDQMLAYAKAGVKFEGSPSDVFLETAKNLRHNMIMTRLNASNEANKYNAEAFNSRIRAARLRTKRNMAVTKGILDIGTSIYSSKYSKETAGLIGGQK